MRVIRERLVTDEDLRPVAVQIEYEDRVEIERRLGLGRAPRETDLASHRGVMALTEEPLAYQERIRGEWP